MPTSFFLGNSMPADISDCTVRSTVTSNAPSPNDGPATPARGPEPAAAPLAAPPSKSTVGESAKTPVADAPGSPAAPPVWFTTRRAKQSVERHASPPPPPPSPRQRKSPRPKLVLKKDDAEPLTWRQKLVLWVVSSAALGYGISFVVHSLLLTALSIVVIQGMVGDAPISTLASEADQEEISEFEEVLDTRADMAGGDLEALELPPVQMVESPLAVPSPEIKIELPAALAAGVGKGSGQGDDEGDGVGAGGRFSFKMPEKGKAVTKGSFTAWTVPENPAPRQNYLIVIQIKLPETVRRYPRKDLNGLVVGTDGYRQKLPPHQHGYLPVEDHETQLVVIVPGAARLVKDTIEIHSKMLGEKQKLQIEFR